MGKLEMLEINPNEMFKQIVEDISKYQTDKIDLRVDSGSGEITLITSKYELKIIINKKWVGYDFSLNKELTEGISQGSAVDTDLYALDYDIEVTREIFSEVRQFVAALLSDKLYYAMVGKKAAFAKPKNDKEYEVRLIPKRRFLVKIEQEVWPLDKVVHNSSFTRLVANE